MGSSDDEAAWPGVPCTSNLWPYTRKVDLFEARRSIGQLVRSYQGMVQPDNREASVLKYIRAAKMVGESIDATLSELVAEARAGGHTWAEIGKVLDVGDTAAHKKFSSGKWRVDDGRLDEIRHEAEVAQAVSQIISGDDPLSLETVRDEVEGESLEARLYYAALKIFEAYSLFTKGNAEWRNADECTESAAESFLACIGKIDIAQRTLVADPAQWHAVSGWARLSSDAGAANYEAPVAYVHLLMYLLMCSSYYFGCALDLATHSTGRSIEAGDLIYLGGSCLMELITVMLREDVTETLLPIVDKGKPPGNGTVRELVIYQ